MIIDKDAMLVFKIQKDMGGINVLSSNTIISDDKYEELMNEIEDDLFNLLDKIEKTLKGWYSEKGYKLRNSFNVGISCWLWGK